MHVLDTSEIVIQSDWCDVYVVFIQVNSSGDVTTECRLSKSQLGKVPIDLIMHFECRVFDKNFCSVPNWLNN